MLAISQFNKYRQTIGKIKSINRILYSTGYIFWKGGHAWVMNKKAHFRKLSAIRKWNSQKQQVNLKFLGCKDIQKFKRLWRDIAHNKCLKITLRYNTVICKYGKSFNFSMFPRCENQEGFFLISSIMGYLIMRKPQKIL